MLVPRKVPGCTCAACTAEAYDTPEPEVAGDEPAPRRSLLRLGSILVMPASTGLLNVSFLIIAFHRFQGTLAPASAVECFRWSAIVCAGSCAIHTACLIGLRIREARS